LKKCPYCAEEVQEDAIKCKYCGEWISKPTNHVNDKEIELTQKVQLT
jgi:uncharacterized membrane protein YvbJ